MQRILALLGTLAISCASVAAVSAVAAPPTVSISYSGSLDTLCAFVRRYEIKEEWKADLIQHLGLFSELWEKNGPPLLRTTEQLTQQAFPATTVRAHLTLCDLPSQSLPFSWLGVVVNMRYALGSFTAPPVPLRYKIGVLYHEILHGFITAHIPANSPLLAQHHDEHPRVRNHLHLLALQKAVYLELALKEELAEVIDIDSQLPDGYYKRAWQIVNQSETDYIKYVEELKAKEP